MTTSAENSTLLQVHECPSPDLLAAAANSNPENPFLTSRYLQARTAMGDRPLLMVETLPSQQRMFSAAFLSSGRLSRSLDIPSLPGNPSNAFLSGLEQMCRRRGIYETTLNTYASPDLTIPPLACELERISRQEFFFDLRTPVEQWKIGRTHRQRIRQAEKLGLQVLHSADASALQVHDALIRDSMQRRHDRGENVSLAQDHSEASYLLRSGAAEIFQAVHDGKVLSSMLVLRACQGGYDHSSGTAPEGMSIGASHFLVFSVARILQTQGCTTFNLGGAREAEQGLRSFKQAFGTQTTQCEMVRASLCTKSRRIAFMAAQTVRRYASIFARPQASR